MSKFKIVKNKVKYPSRLCEDFKDNGYVLIKGLLNKNILKKIKFDLKVFLNKNKHKIKGINFIDKKLKKINTVHNLKNWKYLNKIKKDKNINEIATKILNCRIKDFGAEVFAKPAKYGLKSPVHQDNFYWNIKSNKGLTIWIALDPSNKKNGSIFYYEKSHKLGLLPHDPSYAPGSSQKIANLKNLKKFKKVFPTLEIGDMLIHDCLIAHGSEKNFSKSDRMGLTLRFIPFNSKFNLAKKIKYEKSLIEQQKKRI